MTRPTAIAATRTLAKPILMAGGMIAAAAAIPLLGVNAQATLSAITGQGGVRGPAMFMLVATFLTAIGLPRQVPCFVAGYAFGPYYGTAIALVSQLLACSLDFIWARAIGQEFVRRRFGKALTRIDTTLSRQPFMATLTLRLLPVGSNILLNLAAGLSSVRAAPFLAASALGFLPQTLVFVFFGQGAAPSHGTMILVGGVLFAACAAASIIMLRRKDVSA
jgi:uncharacterized membrane protein YdjX (TVP38/TMEM64 family)